jgi:nitrite reductase/ring-hydroxylating ferredoxin subunit
LGAVVAEFVSVARLDDVAPGRSKVVTVRGVDVALFNVNGTIYAIDNLCPHEGGPLATGKVLGTVVTCPWHRWRFDLATGRSPVNPALGVRVYRVKLEGRDILIELDGTEGGPIWG